MKRRNFVKTVAAGTAGLMIPNYLSSGEGTKWYTYGDMYVYRNRHVPFEVYLLDDGHDFMKENGIYDTLQTIDDPELKEELMWQLDYKKNKYNENFVTDWSMDMNKYLGYLSHGNFQMDLTKIRIGNRGETKLWIEAQRPDPKMYRMIALSSQNGGHYDLGGRFHVNPFYLQPDKSGIVTFSGVPIHEIFHGIFGCDHSDSQRSIMKSGPIDWIGLAVDEFNFVGWDPVEPVKSHPIGIPKKDEPKVSPDVNIS